MAPLVELFLADRRIGLGSETPHPESYKPTAGYIGPGEEHGVRLHDGRPAKITGLVSGGVLSVPGENLEIIHIQPGEVVSLDGSTVIGLPNIAEIPITNIP